MRVKRLLDSKGLRRPLECTLVNSLMDLLHENRDAVHVGQVLAGKRLGAAGAAAC